MIVGLQDSLQAIEQKMTSCFTKIERHLDSLEERMITQSELVSKTSLLQVYNELELGYTFQNLEDIVLMIYVACVVYFLYLSLGTYCMSYDKIHNLVNNY